MLPLFARHFTFAIFALCFWEPAAEAWGRYGHEQVNGAAIEILPDSPLGSCLKTHQRLLIRYGLTPDMDWKANQRIESLPVRAQRARRNADRCEHPLHFFEVDAFLIEGKDTDVVQLPHSGQYTKDLEKYIHLIANKTKGPPTDRDVVKHGTAPWRVLSLYKKGVRALQQGKIHQALLVLGAMGHYVGDLAQPLHTTIHFDGDEAHQGFHHEMDSGLLSSQMNIKALAQRLMATKTEPSTPWTEEQILSELFQLTARSYSLVDPLTKIYQAQCDLGNRIALRPKRRRSLAQASESNQRYCTSLARKGRRALIRPLPRSFIHEMKDIPLPETGFTVQEVLKTRLAEAAVIVSRLWQSAITEAAAISVKCPRSLNFSAPEAILNYPFPDYYPATLNSCRGRSPGN